MEKLEKHTETDASVSAACKSEPDKPNEPSSFPLPREGTEQKPTATETSKSKKGSNGGHTVGELKNNGSSENMEESAWSEEDEVLDLDYMMEHAPAYEYGYFEIVTGYSRPDFVNRSNEGVHESEKAKERDATDTLSRARPS